MAHDHSANGYAGTNGHTPRFTIADRPVPHNLEAERGALGSILLDASMLREIRPKLDVSDLFRDSHQAIYRAILDLDDRGAPVDPLTVAAELSRSGRLDAAGGDSTLGEILAATPHAANGPYYADLVKQNAFLRASIDVANAILDDAYSGRLTAEEMHERTSARTALTPPGTTRRRARHLPAASLDDVERVVGETRWLWEGWLIDSHLTVLASEPGLGKTRLALDLCRRMWNCLPWPDGTMATRPMHTPSLWVAADRHHSQLVTVAKAYGLPGHSVYFSAPPESPIGGLSLDGRRALDELAGRALSCKAGLIVIDTVNKTTRRALYRPEEAEAFFGPILDLAMELRVPVLALTHLSKGGDPLDRRIVGTCRVLWRLISPTGDSQAPKCKLAVTKSIDQVPAPLGVTHSPTGNEYDLNPPEIPDTHGGARTGAGRPSKALQAAMDWLRDYLATGPARCPTTIDAALEAGHAKTTLWRAVSALAVLTEGTEDGKYFRLPDDLAEQGDRDDPAF
jgi:hypothetical protein